MFRRQNDRFGRRMGTKTKGYENQCQCRAKDKVKAEIADDPRIELHDVTSDPASYYQQADVLLFNSVNEVTPLVLPEA